MASNLNDRRVEQSASAGDVGSYPLMPAHVRWVAYTYLVAVPFEIELTMFGRSVSFWLALALLTLVGLQLLAAPTGVFRINTRVVLPPIGILVLAWISSLWSMDRDRTFFAALIMSVTVATWFALAVAISHNLTQAMVALAVGTTIMSGLVLTADVNIDGRAETAANVNDVAVLLAMSSALLLGRTLNRHASNLFRLLYILLAVVHLAALLATGSRAGVVALVCALGFVAAVNTIRFRPGLLVGIIGVVALVVISVNILGIEVPARVLETPAALQSGDLNSRESIWEAAGAGIPSAIGIGFGATPAFMQEMIGVPAVAHSVFVGIALELGLLGIFVWGWMVTRFAFAARGALLSRELILMGMVVAVMAATLTLEARRPMWVFFALLASVAIVARQEPSHATEVRR